MSQVETAQIGHWKVRNNFDDGDLLKRNTNQNMSIGMGIGTRYRNFLKSKALNDYRNPNHRQLACEFDPILNRLTYGFINRALNKPFAFYEDVEDDIYGFGKRIPQSSQIYGRMKKIGLIEYFKVAMPKMLIDGYQMTKPSITLDQLGNVVSISFEQCYSDYEIHQLILNYNGVECFTRADDLFIREHPDLPVTKNEIVEVKINFHPFLSGNRGHGNLKPIRDIWYYGEFIHTYLGTCNNGMGEAYIFKVWDACTKLLEVSENNHFRQDLFSILEVPQLYMNKGNLIDQFAKAFVYARENSQIFAYPKVLDKDGRVTNLPNIMTQNMVRDSQPTRATTTGVGALTDSEWSRITAATGYSISYFMGDPAGAVEAGQVDKMADVQVDIDRFAELTESLIIPVLKWLTDLGIFSDLIDESFDWDMIRIKTHWEIDKENRQMALFEASHMASGGGNPSNFKDGSEAETGTGTPKMPSEKQNSYYYNELFSSRINETITKRASQTGQGKQRAEEGKSKKVKKELGQTKNVEKRACIDKVKKQLREKNPDKDAQQLERQAKEICKGKGGGGSKPKSDKPVDVHGYSRDGGKDHVKRHDRGKPKYTQHKVGVKSYTRGGKKVSGYTRYPQSKRKNEDEIYWAHGYMIANYHVSVEDLGNRLNLEFNEDGWEKDGDIEYVDSEDLILSKFIDPDEDKTRSLMKYFKEDWKRNPKDLPPLLVDGSLEVLDGNHRAYVYRMMYFGEVPVQYMKRKGDQPYNLVNPVNNSVMPLLPIGSSIVKGMGLMDDKLIVQFHKSGKQMGSGSTYGYQFDSDSSAREAYDDMISSTSQGGFVWDRLRGKDIGPAWGTGNPTEGGTTASIVPYEKYGRSPVPTMSGDWQQYQKESKDLQELKMKTLTPEGKELGTKRMYMPEQMGEKRFDPTSKFYTEEMGHGYPFNKPSAIVAPTKMEPQTEPPISKKPKKGGEGSVGRPTKGQPYYQYRKTISKEVPKMIDQIVSQSTQVKQKKTNLAESLHFESVDNSDEFYGIPFEGTVYDVPDELKLNDYDYWFDSKNEAIKYLGGSKSRFYEEIKPLDVVRYNKLPVKYESEDEEYVYAIVNGFSSTNRFQYWVNNKIQVEFQCPEDIKNQVGLEVPLGVYHNREVKNSVDLPEWQVVGTYKVVAYDPEDETDVSRIKINKKRVAEVFSRLEEEDWITPMLNEGKCPDISTSYKAIVKWNSKLKAWIQTGFKLESVAIVPKGNCSAPFCTGDIIRENGKIRDKIKENITKIGGLFKEKGKKLEIDDLVDMALIYEDESEEEEEYEEL